jgi:exosortase
MSLWRTDLPAGSGPPRPGVLAAAVAIGLTAVGATVMLWPEWRRNPDLSHGFFTPVIFALLVAESRRLGPLRWIRAGGAARGVQAGLGLLAVALFALGGLFAASVGWAHPLVLFLAAGSAACLLACGGMILADERVRLVPCNWIAATAILLFVLSAPIPTGTYFRLTLALQGWVTDGVMDMLQLLGVPARQHGNVIELARATVGVAEACSGVRSLISCVFAGFLLAAWQLRRPFRRAVLIAAAPLLALAMNFIRSLTLTLLANRGVDISGAWHDGTGFAILAITTALLAGLAWWLELGEQPTAPPAAASPPPPSSVVGPMACFWPGAALIAAGAMFFAAHFRSTELPVSAPPDLASLLPAEAEGWTVRTATDLYQFAGVLETTHLFQRTYERMDAAGSFNITVYVAYWPAGQTSVSRVASHTPDACWPGAGWIAQSANTRHQEPLPLGGRPLAPSEQRLFQTDRGFTQHVWFWHVYDGRVIDYRDPYSLSALLDLALRYGFRRQGSQYFVRLSGNRPWEQLEREPLVREIGERLHTIGL